MLKALAWDGLYKPKMNLLTFMGLIIWFIWYFVCAHQYEFYMLKVPKSGIHKQHTGPPQTLVHAVCGSFMHNYYDTQGSK